MSYGTTNNIANQQHQPTMNIPRMKTTAGFTLVEIMVAITLSLVLLAGVGQIYASSKESFRVQHNNARMQENQRIAMEFLNRDIRQAGFSDTNAVVRAIAAAGNDVGGANNSDEITISLVSPTDCLGADTPAGGVATNRYFILNQQLMCVGNGNPDQAQPIADGIENMQILYGVNTNPPGPGIPPTANFYRDASSGDAETAGLNLNSVVSVRIALLFRTDEPIKSQATAQSYTLLDADALEFNDRVKRQVVTTTIPLRNM